MSVVLVCLVFDSFQTCYSQPCNAKLLTLFQPMATKHRLLTRTCLEKGRERETGVYCLQGAVTQSTKAKATVRRDGIKGYR
jgi:hypothetical protein